MVSKVFFLLVQYKTDESEDDAEGGLSFVKSMKNVNLKNILKQYLRTQKAALI